MSKMYKNGNSNSVKSAKLNRQGAEILCEAQKGLVNGLALAYNDLRLGNNKKLSKTI